MIKRRNLDPSLQAELDSLSGLGTKYGLGSIWYVDPNAGGSGILGNINSGGGGEAWNEALPSITDAFTIVKPWDTILCAPGAHSGNHITPLNAAAPFVSLIAMRATSLGLAAWAGATDQALPIIQVRARGWRISGFEFDNPTTSNTVSAGIQLYGGGGVNRPDYCMIDNCLFTGGKAGIRYRASSTYIHIHDCQFDFMAGSVAAQDGAIVSADSTHALGGMWLVENNIFRECVNQMNIAGGTRGLNSSVIKGNVFQVDAQSNTGVVLIDIRGGGAGNLIVDNFFGCTESEYGSGSFIRTNASDEGIGNYAADGPCNSVIEH